MGGRGCGDDSGRVQVDQVMSLKIMLIAFSSSCRSSSSSVS